MKISAEIICTQPRRTPLPESPATRHPLVKASGDSVPEAKKGGNIEVKGSCEAGVDQTDIGSETNEAKGSCKAVVDKFGTGSNSKEGNSVQ